MPLDAADKITLEGLERRFGNHTPNGDQIGRYQKIREKAFELAKLIVETCPSSAERSAALTHLDEVVFFATSAIARNG